MLLYGKNLDMKAAPNVGSLPGLKSLEINLRIILLFPTPIHFIEYNLLTK